MATTKTAKVQAEIDKAKAKLAEQQAHLKELEDKRTELENLEIIGLVRGLHIPLDNLAETLAAIKGGAASPPEQPSGRLGPKPRRAKPKPVDEDTGDQEDNSDQEDDSE